MLTNSAETLIIIIIIIVTRTTQKNITNERFRTENNLKIVRCIRDI